MPIASYSIQDKTWPKQYSKIAFFLLTASYLTLAANTKNLTIWYFAKLGTYSNEQFQEIYFVSIDLKRSSSKYYKCPL